MGGFQQPHTSPNYFQTYKMNKALKQNLFDNEYTEIVQKLSMLSWTEKPFKNWWHSSHCYQPIREGNSRTIYRRFRYKKRKKRRSGQPSQDWCPKQIYYKSTSTIFWGTLQALLASDKSSVDNSTIKETGETNRKK